MGFPEADISLFFFINQALRNSVFDALMPLITKNAEMVFLPFVVWFFVREKDRPWHWLALAFFSIALSDGATHALKEIIARPRPCSVLENVNLLVGCGRSFSMPSGHASNAFAFALTFFLLKRNRISGIFLVLAAVIGFSRVYVGVHYLSDVLVGALVGGTAALSAVRLFGWAREIYEQKSYREALYLTLVLVSLFRIYYIITGPFDLSTDEAHYWEWSRRLDWSYYSKGPMIAYLISAGTSFFGDSVFGVRIFAVFLSAFSSLLLFKLGRDLYDEKTGVVSALIVQIVPLYSVFGMLFTIDSPFLFFWILSLYLFWKAVDSEFTEGEKRPAGRYWILLGCAVGLGLLTKYTMAFFYLSGFLFMLFHKDARRLLFVKGPYIALAVGLLFFSPVLAWNSAHDWVTVKHTAGQAHVYDGVRITLNYFFEFLGSQLGVVTPVLFIMTAIALWKLRKTREGAFLFWMSAPVILFFLLKSVQGKVQANWALPGYAAGFIAFSAYYTRNIGAAKKSRKMLVSAACVLAFVLTFFAHFPSLLHLPPDKDTTIRLMGWRELGAEVSRALKEVAADGPVFLFADHYEISSELAFYVEGKPVTYCINLGRRMNQYDLWPGFEDLIGHHAVFVRSGVKPMPKDLKEAFGSYEETVLSLKTRQDKKMKFTLFKCYDFRGITPQPLERY